MSSGIGDIFTNSFGKFKNYLRAAFSELNEYDAEDIVQQTALNLLNQDDDGIAYVTSYIYSALRNGALNFFRKRGREELTEDVDILKDGSPENELMKSELKEHIMDALSLLDEKSRFVITETEINGRSYKELSEQTGEPVGTLLSRKNRAVKKLMVMLGEYYNEEG